MIKEPELWVPYESCRQRIADLEAENKRLREDYKALHDSIRTCSACMRGWISDDAKCPFCKEQPLLEILPILLKGQLNQAHIMGMDDWAIEENKKQWEAREAFDAAKEIARAALAEQAQ